MALRPAVPDDAGMLGEATTYFDRIEKRIQAGEILVLDHDGEPVGFGIREMSRFLPGRASIGMFAREEQRQRGVGTAVVTALIQLCLDEEIEPVAGCWYYNHRSRCTLQHVGMASTTRLLKVEF